MSPVRRHVRAFAALALALSSALRVSAQTLGRAPVLAAPGGLAAAAGAVHGPSSPLSFPQSALIPVLSPVAALTRVFPAPVVDGPVPVIAMPAGVPVRSAAAFHPQLNDELFAVIQHVAKKFMAKYPPTEYFYVGLGRSPHGVLGYIDALGLGDVRYTPMSNGKFHFQDHNFRNIGTPEREREMKDHIAKVLPSDAELKGRKILIVDFAHTAAGIQVGFYYAVEALFERGFDLTRLRGAGFSLPHPIARDVWRDNTKMESVTVTIDDFRLYEIDKRERLLPGESSRLYGDMMYGHDGDWLEQTAPVGWFDLHTLEKTDKYSEARPEYQSFLAWLRDARRRLGPDTVIVSP